MQVVALVKVLLGAAAAEEIVTHVVEGAGVTRHVGTSGTVVKTFPAPVRSKKEYLCNHE